MAYLKGYPAISGHCSDQLPISSVRQAKHARKTLTSHAAVESAPERVQGEREPEQNVEALNKFSRNITQPKKQGGSQAMLYATGLKDEDMQKPQVIIHSEGYKQKRLLMASCDRFLAHHVQMQYSLQVGISSVWYEGNPCNMHLLELADFVKAGVQSAGMVGFR